MTTASVENGLRQVICRAEKRSVEKVRDQPGRSRTVTTNRPLSPPPCVVRVTIFLPISTWYWQGRCRAQSPLRRSDTVAGRYPDDQGDHRHRRPARHLRARPHHRRQERARQFEGDAVDLKAGKPTRCSLPGKISKTTPCKAAPGAVMDA